MRGRADRLAQEAAALAAIVAATLVATWRWMPGPAVFPARDTAFTLLNMDHLGNVLVDGRDWTRGPLGWPLPGSVTQADWVLGEAIAAWPLTALGLPPLYAHNLLAWLALVGTGWACHLLAQALTGPGAHTWVAGMAGALVPLQLAHAQHLNLLLHGVTVAAVLGLGAALAHRHVAGAALAGLVVGLSAHLGVYLGLHTVVAAGVVAAVAAVARVGSWRAWAAAAAGLVLGLATLAPVAWVYASYAAEYDVVVDPLELRGWSWQLAHTLEPVRGAWLHGPLAAIWPVMPDRQASMNPANPGYLALGLAVGGLVVGWRRGATRGWAWAALAAVAVVGAALALGPDVVWERDRVLVPGPYRLIEGLPGGAGLRAPARWLVLPLLTATPWIALGARWGLARLGRAWPVGVGVAGLVVALETPAALVGPPSAVAIHPDYAALDEVTDEGAIYDEVLRHTGTCGCQGGQALNAALYHQRPLVGSHFARKTKALTELGRIAGSWPSTDAVRVLRDAGVAVVLEHPPLQPLGEVADEVDCREVGEHRLCELHPVDPRTPPRHRRVAEGIATWGPHVPPAPGERPADAVRSRP